MSLSAVAGEGVSTEVASRRFAGLAFAVALWLGLSISLLGDTFYRVGLTWNVTADGAGAGRAALLGASMALPVAALGMFAGVVVDRYSRPATLIVTDVIRLVIVAQLGLWFLLGDPALPPVLVGAAVLAGSGVCFTPALQAWLPDLFPDRDRLVRFDALVLSTVSAAGVVGPATAGLLYPLVGVGGLLVFDAVSFAVSAVAVGYVVRNRPPAAPTTEAPPRPRLVRGVGEGLSFIFGNPVLRPQFSVYPFMECASYAVLFVLPAYLVSTDRATSWLFGALLAANAAGRVVGAWVIAHCFLRHHRGRVLSVNHIIQGLALGLFCLAPTPLLGLPAFLLMGLPAGAAQIAVSSWVQTNVERQLRGRAFGTLSALVLWLMPLGPVVFGWVGSWQSPRIALLATAATFCAGGAVILSARAVRTLR